MEIRIEEDIKFIDEMVKEYNTHGDLDNPDYEDTDRIYKAIENILKKIQELEEDNKRKDMFVEMAKEVIENSILKQKVKDKIEEINKEYEDSKDKNGESEYYYPDYTIRKFKELLEEK